jgi:hypothetical protein
MCNTIHIKNALEERHISVLRDSYWLNISSLLVAQTEYIPYDFW